PRRSLTPTLRIWAGSTWSDLLRLGRPTSKANSTLGASRLTNRNCPSTQFTDIQERGCVRLPRQCARNPDAQSPLFERIRIRCGSETFSRSCQNGLMQRFTSQELTAMCLHQCVCSERGAAALAVKLHGDAQPGLHPIRAQSQVAPAARSFRLRVGKAPCA